MVDVPSSSFGWMIDAGEPIRSTRALLASVRAELRQRCGIEDAPASLPTGRVVAALQPMALQIMEAGFGGCAAATHPDHGGDHESMRTLPRARDALGIPAVAA